MNRRYRILGASTGRVGSVAIPVCASIIMLVLLDVGSGSAVVAQSSIRFAGEARGAMAFPTGTWGQDDPLSRGLGYGVNAQVRIGFLDLYGGWDRFEFTVRQRYILDVADYAVTDAGFRVGAMAPLPLARRNTLAPFILAGAVYNRSQSRRTLAEAVADERVGDRELGFEVGGGLDIPLGSIGEVVSVTPALRYRSQPTAYVGFKPAGGARATTAYWIVDVGLNARSR